MKTKEIEDDMLDYIELRDCTHDGQDVSEIRRSRILTIESKYNHLFKDHRGISIDYYGISNTHYESTKFEEFLKILMNLKQSETKKKKTDKNKLENKE